MGDLGLGALLLKELRGKGPPGGEGQRDPDPGSFDTLEAEGEAHLGKPAGRYGQGRLGGGRERHDSTRGP